MRKWPDLATATLERLKEIKIEARLDPRDRGLATCDLYFEGRRIGATDAEGEGAIVKIVSWPGLSLSGLVAVRVMSVPDLPALRARLIEKMPPGFETAISSDSVRREKASSGEEIARTDLPPVDETTRRAWEANRQQAALWRSRPVSVTTTSEQTGSEAQFMYCAGCHLETSHVLTGQRSTGRGKNWRGWQCTVCSISVQRPIG